MMIDDAGGRECFTLFAFLANRMGQRSVVGHTAVNLRRRRLADQEMFLMKSDRFSKFMS